MSLFQKLYQKKTKVCSECKKSKSVDEFWKNTATKDKLRGKCKSCNYAENRKWVTEKPPRTKGIKKKEKTCSKCGETKAINHFPRNRRVCNVCRKNYQQKWYSENREELNEKAKKFRKDNPEAVKNKNLIKQYGITMLEYKSILKKQKNKCAICKSKKPYGAGAFHVDHDHKTGKVRGLLCHYCNIALGNFKDSTVNLMNAIVYINDVDFICDLIAKAAFSETT